MDCFNTSRAKFFDYYYYENYPLYCANIASKFMLQNMLIRFTMKIS